MSILMLAGIRDIANFKYGYELGFNIEYEVRENLNGLAEAVITSDDSVAIILEIIFLWTKFQ